MQRESDFKAEVFYPLFLNLQDFYFEAYFFVIREAYSQALKECAREGAFDDKKFISVFKSWISPGKKQYDRPVFRPLALGIDLLQELHDRLFYLEELLERYPDKRVFVSDKIQLLKSLYSCLSDLGVVAGKNPSKDQPQACAQLLRLIIESITNKAEHAVIRQSILQDNSNSIVFSIGSGGNAAQMIPPFTEQLDGHVTVYNFDPTLTRLDRGDIGLRLAELSKEHVSPKYFPIKFPNVYGGVGRGDAIEPEAHRKLLKSARQHEIDEYYNLLITKKTQNPDFKLVLLYCCSSVFGEYEQQLAQRLLDSGSFTLGVDLELVHAYFSTSPVIVYRDIDKIERPNHILNMTGPDDKIENHYDPKYNMFVFYRLNEEVKIFDRLNVGARPHKPN